MSSRPFFSGANRVKWTACGVVGPDTRRLPGTSRGRDRVVYYPFSYRGIGTITIIIAVFQSGDLLKLQQIFIAKRGPTDLHSDALRYGVLFCSFFAPFFSFFFRSVRGQVFRQTVPRWLSSVPGFPEAFFDLQRTVVFSNFPYGFLNGRGNDSRLVTRLKMTFTEYYLPLRPYRRVQIFKTFRSFFNNNTQAFESVWFFFFLELIELFRPQLQDSRKSYRTAKEKFEYRE